MAMREKAEDPNIAGAESELENLFIEKHEEKERVKKEYDGLMYKLVSLRARCREHIYYALSQIQAYITKEYGACDIGMINVLRDGLTMCPISIQLYRRSDDKWCTQIRHNAILYEWKGKRIMYNRADNKAEGYYDDCDEYNGLTGLTSEINDREWFASPRKYTWFSTDWDETTDGAYDKAYMLHCEIETIVKYNRKNICTAVRTLPPQYWLIPMVFDLSQGYPQLLCNTNTLYTLSQFTYITPWRCFTELDSMADSDADAE